MNIISSFLQQLPLYVLSLPVILLALSVHETAHGWVAYKLGDPTAKNLGRLTLNPVKHIDPIGFLCMFLFHFGWAKPVPIVSRNFRNPRRDMALSALAGPISNILQAFLCAGLLRLAVGGMQLFFPDDIKAVYMGIVSSVAVVPSIGFRALSILTVMLYLGVVINCSYAVFNMIPIPPLDGSRFFYVFLPTRIYFGLMKYERIISLLLLAALWFGLLSLPLSWAVGGIQNGFFALFGMPEESETYRVFNFILYYVSSLISL